jgi:hypothetical protein
METTVDRVKNSMSVAFHATNGSVSITTDNSPNDIVQCYKSHSSRQRMPRKAARKFPESLPGLLVSATCQLLSLLRNITEALGRTTKLVPDRRLLSRKVQEEPLQPHRADDEMIE